MVTWPVAVVFLYLLISAWVSAAVALSNEKGESIKGTSLLLTAFLLAWITPAILAASFFKKPRK
ncbi:hypothetical protein [Leisingera daeponensis]|uniref:hypothetical protein n=1 Tax=Leisingera daeponensis TaxID=405746 RepID=UPI001C94DA7C|nr:hypothetical protein [Leisingera daeponensis]MBY6055402.1 hypothetical protein [Leisingera daeponensis]